MTESFDEVFRNTPIARMHAGHWIGLLSEIARLTRERRPAELAARIDQERRGGISTASTEVRVSGSRRPKMPELDEHDAVRDGQEKAYEQHLRSAIRELNDCALIETKVLIPVHVATRFEAALASDVPSCRSCGLTKEQYAKKNKGRLWKIRGGDCPACWQAKRTAREAELAQIEGVG